MDQTRSLEAGEHVQRALESTENVREHSQDHPTAGPHFHQAVENGRGAAVTTDMAQEEVDPVKAEKLHNRAARQADKAWFHHWQAASAHFKSSGVPCPHCGGREHGCSRCRGGTYMESDEDHDNALNHPGYVLNHQASNHWREVLNSNKRAAAHLKRSRKSLDYSTHIKTLRDKYRGGFARY